MKKGQSLLFPGFALVWVLFHWNVYVSDTFQLPRDNYEVGFALFQYFVQYLKIFHELPSWVYTLQGGIWFEPLANNYSVLVPYRFIGYALALLGMPINVAFKLSLLSGLFIFLFGCRQLFRRLGWDKGLTEFALFALFLSSIGQGWLHSEYLLTAVFYLPFLWLCALAANEKPLYWILFLAIVGQALNTQYPHLLVGYLAILGAAMWRKVPRATLSIAVPAVLALLLAASPLIYSITHFKDRMVSPDRGMSQGIVPESKEAFLQMNQVSASSVHPKSFASYLGAAYPIDKRLGELDENYLFATVAAPLALLFFSPAFLAATVLALGILSLGIYNPVLSYLWQVPGLSIFRQWLLFASALDLHWAILSVLFVWRFTVDKRSRMLGIVGSLVIAALGANLYYWFPPFLFLSLSFFMMQPQKYARPLLVGWVLLGGFSWSLTAISKVEKFPNYGKLIQANRPKTEFILPVPWVGRVGEWKQLVLPKGSENLESWKPSLPNVLMGVIDHKLTLRGNLSGKIQIPQYSDGNWLAHVDGKDFPVAPGPVIELNVPAETAQVSLSRKPSPWWLCVLASLLLPAGTWVFISKCALERIAIPELDVYRRKHEAKEA